MAAFEVASFETNSLKEAETSVSGKAECLLAIGEDKKSKLFGPSPLIVKNFLNKLFL